MTLRHARSNGDEVVWERGPFRVERTGDPGFPFRYLYRYPRSGGRGKLLMPARDPELQALIRVPRKDPQREAMWQIIDDLHRRGIG